MGNQLKRTTQSNRPIAGLPHSALRTPRSARLVPLMLSWFVTNARNLPWRRTHDPYAIWVSEIMLQQTQVKTVIPYWERWMRELPTIATAAKASPAKLHKLWEGLGYYTRVRNLQKAAQQIVASHERKFPDTFDDVLALPGIGRYTAGAICSIAFNQPIPILDGNVIRVLTRLYGIATNPHEKQTTARLWLLAEELVSRAYDGWGERPREPVSHKVKTARRESRPTNACSHLNQSLMELGALVCTPRAPNCIACPVQKLCVAFRENRQEQLPNLCKRETATKHRFIAFVVQRDGKFLVHQRPAGVINGNLWEFPNVEVENNNGRVRHSARAAARKSQTGAQRTDAPYQPTHFHFTAAKPFCTIKHSITRYRITLEAWHAELANPSTQIAGHWLTLKQLHQLAFTSAHKKILKAITEAKTHKLKKS